MHLNVCRMNYSYVLCLHIERFVQSFNSSTVISTWGQYNEAYPIFPESFLLEVDDDEWIEQECLILDDKTMRLIRYTQATNIPINVIRMLQESTGDSYPLSWSGFSTPLGPVMSNYLNVATSKWHEALTGLPRSFLLTNAAKSLVYSYKIALKAKVDQV